MENNLLLMSLVILTGLTLVYIFIGNTGFKTNEQYFHLKRNDLFTSYYINLDTRTDRSKDMVNEFKSTPFKLKRISAIKHDFGALGCSLSHIKCLKKAIAHNLPWVVIFEDDAQFAIDKQKAIEIFRSIEDFLKHNKWNVILLSYNKAEISGDNTSNRYIKKISNAQTTGSYLVHSNYYKTLLNNFKHGYDLLIDIKASVDKKATEAVGIAHIGEEGAGREESGDADMWDSHDTAVKKKAGPYALDQYWKRLQEKDNWFCIDPMLFKQRPSYSDIEHKKVAYKMHSKSKIT